MDYLDHHSRLMNADFLGGFGIGTRVKIVDCILVIAEDLRGDPPAAPVALIAVTAESAFIVRDVDPDAHMLCVWRPEFERIVYRMFPEDLASSIIQTLFPHPGWGLPSCP